MSCRPKFGQKFSELKAYRQVAVLPNNTPSSNPDIQRFIVKTTPTLKLVATPHFRRDAVGDVVSYFGTCSCGTPACTSFPCNHHKTVAISRNLDENLLIPLELTTARWREQYPASITVSAPTWMAFGREITQISKWMPICAYRSSRLPSAGTPGRSACAEAWRLACSATCAAMLIANCFMFLFYYRAIGRGHTPGGARGARRVV